MNTKKEEEKRKKINDDILRRFKAGEQLQDPASLTWFPPRPIIEKDSKLVKKLYGENAKVINSKGLKITESESEESDSVKESEGGRETQETERRNQEDEGS